MRERRNLTNAKLAKGKKIERKQTEKVLQESEEKFRSIFETAVDGILIADVENKKFVDGNKAFSQMLGYSLEEIKNLGVMDIHPEKDIPYVVEQFEKQTKGEITLAKNIPVKRKDGTVFHADINSIPITLAGKSCLMGIFRDITERKRAEEKLQESEEKLRVIFESINDGVNIVDLEGNILEVNDAHLRIFGCTHKGELIGQNAFDSVAKKDRARAMEGMRNFLEKGFSVPTELTLLRKDGREFPAELSVAILRDSAGNPVGVISVTRDITERKRAEEKIRRRNELLENVLESITYPFYGMNAS